MTPELTLEQKLRIAIAHREYIKTETVNKLALQALSSIVDQVGIELGLEKGKYTVNLDQLTLIETNSTKE